uniref:Tumor necrosis factor receptor superfamily, member 14 n=2 Tax=Nothobranchius pienaari TaxID=704102 RepID=A0A1A8QSU5_9TELE
MRRFDVLRTKHDRCESSVCSIMIYLLLQVLVFAGPASCCGAQEYRTSLGQCCPECHEGTVVVRDCTVDSGTRCGPCETGTFMNRPNGMTKCFSCTSCDPGLGLLTRQRCSATSDSVCGVLDGFFCRTQSETGCSLAEKHSACQHGQRIKQAGTSRNDTVCEDCQGGSFSPDGVSCSPWTRCSKGQIKVKDGSSTSDVVCSNAARHRFCLFLPVALPFLTLCWCFTKVCT